MEFSVIAIIFFTVVLFVVIVIIGNIQREKRRKELQAWANKYGLRFNPDYDYSIEERYSQFSCLRQGSGRYAFNVISGELTDRNLLAFDYHYETHSTGPKGQTQTHHHYFSALILQTNLPLKPLFIRPEGFFDKITEFFGMDDIDFESSEFSRTFYIKSPDKKWAYDVIQQSTMEFLLAAPRFTLQFHDRDIMAFRGDTLTTPDFDAALGVIEGIMERLPDYLIRELKGDV